MMDDSLESYLREHRINDLFQSLTIGLVASRPDDHLQYLISSLQQVASSGWRGITWDTFLPSSPARQRLQPLLPTPPSLPKPVANSNLMKSPLPSAANHVMTLPGETANANDGNMIAEDEDEVDNFPLGSIDVDAYNDKPKAGRRQPLRKKGGSKRLGGKKHRGDHVTTEEQGEGESYANNEEDNDSDDEQEQDNWDEQEDGDGELPLGGEVQALDDAEDEVMLASQAANVFTDPSCSSLPPVASNVVRIFISSTFSDFKAERNALARIAYPDLQRYCNGLGLDFQVVDMRWGVTDDVISDQQVSQLCIRQIRSCQQLSRGPNFVALVGDRYGFRPLLSEIEREEFDMLLSIVREKDEETAAILESWFQLDSNSIPANYVLQPIATKLTYYSDLSAENKAEHERDVAEWERLQHLMHDALEEAAVRAVSTNRLSPEHVTKFQISVTEGEIAEGIMNSSDAHKRAYCCIRQLNGLTLTSNETGSPDQRLAKFVDLDRDCRSINVNHRALLEKLVKEKITPKLEEANQVRRYSVTWTGEALEESRDDAHTQYLNEFVRDFITAIQSIIDNCLQTNTDEHQVDDEVYSEVLHHVNFARIKNEFFFGREDSLSEIRKYIESRRGQVSPLIVYGTSGSGKTSLMARSAMSVHSWIRGNKCRVVVRFLGTSPTSSNILHVIQSLIGQIYYILGKKPPNKSSINKIQKAKKYFWNLLEDADKKMSRDQKLVIFLDSVDQLQTAYGAHELYWLPRQLPANVRIVVSLISDVTNCLVNARQKFPNSPLFHELKPLPLATADEITREFLRMNQRALTAEQNAVVMETFSRCQQPLFLKLILDNALSWRSYTTVNASIFPNDVRGLIEKHFERLERIHGKVFTAAALGYLTCGRGGLSAVEIEDALSCDNEVLNDVYVYHDPPVEQRIRIPTLMWLRLQDDLGQYLVERHAEGKDVLAWYHRQFWEAAQARYCASNSDGGRLTQLHSALADLYLQEKGIRKTLVLEKRKGRTFHDADRGVTPQTLTVKNIRKLNSLPYHLLLAGRLTDLREHCLINFRWLFIKLMALGVADTVQDLTTLLDWQHFDDVELMQMFFELAYEALKMDPLLFACQLRERLASCRDQHPFIARCIGDAETWLQQATQPLLLPLRPLGLHGVDSPLRFSAMVGFAGVVSPDEKSVVCSWMENATKSSSNKLQILRLDTKDVVGTKLLSKPTPYVITHDSKRFAYTDRHKIKICDLDSGENYQEYAAFESKTVSTARCCAVSDNDVYFAFGIRLGAIGKGTSGAWKKQSQLFLVANSLDSDQVTAVAGFRSRKHVDTVFFCAKDSVLIATSRDTIATYSVPALDETSNVPLNYLAFSNTWTQLTNESGATDLYCLASNKQLTGIVLLICNNFEPSIRQGDDEDASDAAPSPPKVLITKLKLNEEEHSVDQVATTGGRVKGNRCNAFGFHVKTDRSVLVFGIVTDKSSQESESVLYRTAGDGSGLKKWILGREPLNTAKRIEVTRDFDKAFVGWRRGQVSIVHMSSPDGVEKPVQSVTMHENLVQHIQIFDRGTKLLTMAADRYLKVWDLNMLLSVEQKKVSAKETAVAADDAEADNSGEGDTPWQQPAVYLSNDEPVTGFALNGDTLVTVPPFSNMSPKFWKVDTGEKVWSLFKAHVVLYKKAFNASGLPFKKGSHGTIQLLNDLIIYKRTARLVALVYIASGNQMLATATVDGFIFQLLPNYSMPLLKDAFGSEVIFFICEGELRAVDVRTMKPLFSITFPSIMNEVGDVEKQGGKRRLMNYEAAITLDAKYFLIINHSPSKVKHFDVFDIADRQYVGRQDLVHWCAMQRVFHNIFYLVKRTYCSRFEVVSQRFIQPTDKFDYKCLIEAKEASLSKDKKLACEMFNKFVIVVWDVETEKEVCYLRGHTATVRCACFSDDSRLLVSASFDHTVRVWSLGNGGQQVTLFHMPGAIENIGMTPSCRHIIVHYFTGFKNNHAAILEIKSHLTALTAHDSTVNKKD